MSRKEREYKQCREKFAELLKQKRNRKCADCTAKAPTWTSSFKPDVCDAAVFICLRCAGIHRGLGVHITFVQSATIDDWNIKKFNKFKSMGGGDNMAMNARYEAKLPKYSKPDQHTDKPVLREFIKQKYIQKKWYSNKPKKVKTKNTSQPLLQNKEKNKEKDTDKYDEEEKSEIMTINNDYKSPQHQHKSEIIPDLLSSAEMKSIAPTKDAPTDNDGIDLFDDIFSKKTSSTNDGNTNSKQNIMDMFNNTNQQKSNGLHDAFNPDFQKQKKWNSTGQYELGINSINNVNAAKNAQLIETLWNGNSGNNNNSNWNGFDDNTGNKKMDSKSAILQQYKPKQSVKNDHFMTSIYVRPQYNNYNMGYGQYISNPLKNDGYKKNNYKPTQNKPNFGTVSTSDELFSEFKI